MNCSLCSLTSSQWVLPLTLLSDITIFLHGMTCCMGHGNWFCWQEVQLGIQPSKTLCSNGRAVLSLISDSAPARMSSTHSDNLSWLCNHVWTHKPQGYWGFFVDFPLTNLLRHHAVKGKAMLPLIIPAKSYARHVLSNLRNSSYTSLSELLNHQ